MLRSSTLCDALERLRQFGTVERGTRPAIQKIGRELPIHQESVSKSCFCIHSWTRKNGGDKPPSHGSLPANGVMMEFHEHGEQIHIPPGSATRRIANASRGTSQVFRELHQAIGRS